jgi:hypothetical protein
LHLRSERQQDKHLSLRLDANRDAVEITMTYEGIEYAIRAGLGRNEWVLTIAFISLWEKARLRKLFSVRCGKQEAQITLQNILGAEARGERGCSKQ